MNASKAIRLLSLLPVRPVEFYDRVATVVEVRKENQRLRIVTSHTVTAMEALGSISDVSSDDIANMLLQSELQTIETAVAEEIASTRSSGPFDPMHNGDFSLARSIYLICSLLRPDVVVETGVAYGVTSAFALHALAKNGNGSLLSVDLPPLGKRADEHVGKFIPMDLRRNWHLYRGSSKRVLPDLLSVLGKVDLFIHDSLHTYRNMKFEFETVWRYLRPGGVLVADDVELNNAFLDFVAVAKPSFSAVIKEENKDALFGIMVKRV